MGNEFERGQSRSRAARSRRQSSPVYQEMQRRTGAGYGTVQGVQQPKRSSKTRRRIITAIIAECFALLFIFSYGFFARRWNMIQRMDDWVPEEVENPNFSVDLPQYEKQKGHWGIYIFGVDSRGSNVGKGTNADVNMICDINHDTGEIRLVSVFRDSYLQVNDSGSYNKINQAYFTGGPSNAAKMLNKNLDLNVGDFVTFNWKAVADGINLLGGIDMEISKAEFYYINSFITETVEATGVYSTHLKHAGMNHLDGVQAVAYGRLRLMDTDFARTERQRKVIQAAFEKAKEADLATLNQLTLVLFPQVATSVDMQDILSLVGDMKKYYIGETGGFPFARGDANMGKKGACVIPQTLESNVKELHQFLYGEENYIPSDTVIQISSRISSETGMYSQGVSVGHVSTAGGVVPSATKAAQAAKEEEPKKTEEETNRETKEEETGESREEESRDREEEERPSAETRTVEDVPRRETRPSAAALAETYPEGYSPADRRDNVPVAEPTAPRQSSENPMSPTAASPRESGANPTAQQRPDETMEVRPGETGGPGGTSPPSPQPDTSEVHPGAVSPSPTDAPGMSPGGPGAGGSAPGNDILTVPEGPGGF